MAIILYNIDIIKIEKGIVFDKNQKTKTNIIQKINNNSIEDINKTINFCPQF